MEQLDEGRISVPRWTKRGSAALILKRDIREATAYVKTPPQADSPVVEANEREKEAERERGERERERAHLAPIAEVEAYRHAAPSAL